MPMYVFVRGRVKVYCLEPGCGWSSKKFPDISGTHLPFAHHNFEKHPGVFPRWNPHFKAIEKRKKGGVNHDQQPSSPADPEGAEGPDQEGVGQSKPDQTGSANA